MKYFIVFLSALLLACDDTPRSRVIETSYPPELVGCKYLQFQPQGDNGPNLYVLRCPNSETAISHYANKQHTTNVVIDQ